MLVQMPLASYGVMAAILQFLNGCALTSPWFPFQDFSMFIGPKMHLSHEWLGKNSGGAHHHDEVVIL